MSCARCGCGIYKTEEFISLNKVWHKNCFNCYQCGKRLDKDSAKIFQGELFCECCYTNVIEKLFEVISTPSINRPSKVASTPSCAVNDPCIAERIKNCENIIKNFDSCGNKDCCSEAEKKVNECIQRTVHSCSCIPSVIGTKDEYCFVFPIPREVANYYNRAHMKNKACKDPINCTRPQGTTCSCRNTACPLPKCQIQVRTLKNQCSCNSSPPVHCRNPSPQNCSCFSSSKPSQSPVVLKKGFGYLSQKPTCCDSCSAPNRCVSCNSSPPCQCCSWCKKKSQPCTAECSQDSNYSTFECSPKCCPTAQCRPPPRRYVLPPRCCLPQQRGLVQCCSSSSPPPCCPQEMEKRCCSRYNPSLLENSKNGRCQCCYQKSPKYCICGSLTPCDCKMSQIKAQCTVCCIRCGQKVYAAEKILVSSGAFHTSCFTCFCCKKCLDVKNVFEGCGEIYCKQCYNHFFGVEYYGYGGKNC